MSCGVVVQRKFKRHFLKHEKGQMVWTGRPLIYGLYFPKLKDTLTMADVEDDVVDDAGSGAAGGAAGNGKRFEVKKWNAVGRPAICAVRWPRCQAVRASARMLRRGARVRAQRRGR
jgi:hypothetical protein